MFNAPRRFVAFFLLVFCSCTSGVLTGPTSKTQDRPLSTTTCGCSRDDGPTSETIDGDLTPDTDTTKNLRGSIARRMGRSNIFELTERNHSRIGTIKKQKRTSRVKGLRARLNPNRNEVVVRWRRTNDDIIRHFLRIKHKGEIIQRIRVKIGSNRGIIAAEFFDFGEIYVISAVADAPGLLPSRRVSVKYKHEYPTGSAIPPHCMAFMSHWEGTMQQRAPLGVPQDEMRSYYIEYAFPEKCPEVGDLASFFRAYRGDSYSSHQFICAGTSSVEKIFESGDRMIVSKSSECFLTKCPMEISYDASTDEISGTDKISDFPGDECVETLWILRLHRVDVTTVPCDARAECSHPFLSDRYKCGRASYEKNAPLVCCKTTVDIAFVVNEESENISFCAGLGEGAICGSDEMCKSGRCYLYKCIDNAGNQNLPPTAWDDTFSTTTEEIVYLDGLLANDTNHEGQLDLVYVGGEAYPVALPSGGLVQMEATEHGSRYYYDPRGLYDPPTLGEAFVDTFTYSISDGVGGTAEATITVVVSRAQQDPHSGYTWISHLHHSELCFTIDANSDFSLPAYLYLKQCDSQDKNQYWRLDYYAPFDFTWHASRNLLPSTPDLCVEYVQIPNSKERRHLQLKECDLESKAQQWIGGVGRDASGGAGVGEIRPVLAQQTVVEIDSWPRPMPRWQCVEYDETPGVNEGDVVGLQHIYYMPSGLLVFRPVGSHFDEGSGRGLTKEARKGQDTLPPPLVGTCMDEATCSGPFQVPLTDQYSQCNTPEICCFNVPSECSSIGGQCVGVDKCRPPSSSFPKSEKRCPGNTVCCVRDDVCSSAGGECRSYCVESSLREVPSKLLCPESEICCVSTIGCIDQHNKPGHCLPKDHCIGGKILSGWGEQGECMAHETSHGCCVPTHQCSFQHSGNTVIGECVMDDDTVAVEEKCSGDSNIARDSFDSNCPYGSSCCGKIPERRWKAVSNPWSLKFESKLVKGGIFLEDKEILHEAQFEVQCFQFIKSGSTTVVFPSLREGTIEVLRSDIGLSHVIGPEERVVDWKTLHVDWIGLAWEGDGQNSLAGQAFEDVEELFEKSVGMLNDANLFYIAQGVVSEPFLYDIKPTPAVRLSGIKSYFKGNWLSWVGIAETGSWLLKEYLDLRFWWFYRRNFVFQCKPIQTNDSGDIQYSVEAFEIWGDSTNYSPMVEQLNEDQGSIEVYHRRGGTIVEQFKIGTLAEGAGFSDDKRFSIETQLLKSDFGDDTILLHDRVVIGLACRRDDGRIIETGLLGPFILQSGSSWWTIVSEDIHKRQAPAAVTFRSTASKKELNLVTAGFAYDGPTDVFVFSSSVGKVSGTALTFLSFACMKTLKAAAVAAATGVGSVPALVTLGIAGVSFAIGIGVSWLVDELGAHYSFGYNRHITFECKEDGFGRYIVSRKEEKEVCMSIKSNEEEGKYYARLEKGGEMVGGLYPSDFYNVDGSRFEVIDECPSRYAYLPP